MHRMFSALAFGMLVAATMTAQSHPEVADAARRGGPQGVGGRDREAKRSGGFRNDTGTRTFRQTSLVSDPSDGRIPAFTPWAESRRATRDRGSFGEGPFDSPVDFTLYDRCITRGVIGRTEDRALDVDAKRGIVRTRKAVQGNINAAPTAAEE